MFVTSLLFPLTLPIQHGWWWHIQHTSQGFLLKISTQKRSFPMNNTANANSISSPHRLKFTLLVSIYTQLLHISTIHTLTGCSATAQYTLSDIAKPCYCSNVFTWFDILLVFFWLLNLVLPSQSCLLMAWPCACSLTLNCVCWFRFVCQRLFFN